MNTEESLPEDTVVQPTAERAKQEPAVETPAPTQGAEAGQGSSGSDKAEAAPVAERKIAIGSQRDAADKSLTPTQPKAVQAAVANPIQLGETATDAAPIELPEIQSDAGLSDDLEAEIEAAMGGFSMDQVVSEAETVATEIEPGTRIKAPVTKIHDDHVFVKLDGQQEGVAALHHFKEPPSEGDLIEVIVRGQNREDGLYELAVPGAAISATDWDELNEGDVIEAMVTGSNTGGLEAAVNAIKGFIPASQIDRFRVEDFSSYLNRKLPCVIVEVNPDKRRLVLSHRAVLERENEAKRQELLAELKAGQIREGTVTKLMDFGAFVDLGGAEGLIHISKLSWSRVKHPSEVLQVGDTVKVKVESVDSESNRISLSHRDTLDHPWEGIQDQFQVDQVLTGTVTRIADFGAFVKLAPGIEGLVHISEISYKRVIRVSTHLQEGQELEVKILSIDSDGQKISLSHKACLAPPPVKKKEGDEETLVDEPARELTVPASEEPLKGGTDRKSGGESIGLNW